MNQWIHKWTSTFNRWCTSYADGIFLSLCGMRNSVSVLCRFPVPCIGGRYLVDRVHILVWIFSWFIQYMVISFHFVVAHIDWIVHWYCHHHHVRMYVDVLLSLDWIHSHFVHETQDRIPRTGISILPFIWERFHCGHLHCQCGSHVECGPVFIGAYILSMDRHLLIICHFPSRALFPSMYPVLLWNIP